MDIGEKDFSIKEGIRLICFLVVFVIMLMMVSYIVRTNGPVKNRYAGFYSEPKDSIQVMFYGSSAISRSIAPGFIWKRYGVTSYALSSNSQRTKAIGNLLEETYRRQSPGLVVIDTRIFCDRDEKYVKDEPHLRETTDNLRYSLHRIKVINDMVENPEMDKLSFYFDIIKYHSNYAMFFDKNELMKIFYSKNDPEKGFEPIDDTFYHTTHTQWDKVSPSPIEPVQEKILLDLLDLLDKNHQKALFITSITKEYDDEMAMTEYISNILEERGYDYLNLNKHYKEIYYDGRSDLTDGIHTNTIGAAKCSDFIMSYIMDNFVLKKPVNIKKQPWDEAAEVFTKHLETAIGNLMLHLDEATKLTDEEREEILNCLKVTDSFR